MTPFFIIFLVSLNNPASLLGYTLARGSISDCEHTALTRCLAYAHSQ
jgi:hypothetical protein